MLQGISWARFGRFGGGSWVLFWCLCGFKLAPRISKTFCLGHLHPNAFAKTFCSPKPRFVQKCRFLRRKIRVWEVERTNTKKYNLKHVGGKQFPCEAYVCVFDCFALCFQIVVVLTLEPLGVEFELPSGPSHHQTTLLHDGKG